MVMPLSATFCYVATVPERSEWFAAWSCKLVEPVRATGRKASDQRLVGYAPQLHISDAGPLANPGVEAEIRRSCIMLTASNREDASASGFAFHVSSDLLASIQPGDQLCMSRTQCGGLGVSILRNNGLIAAAGALTAVPLGAGVEAATRSERWHRIRRGIRRMVRLRPRWRERPLKVKIGRKSRTLGRGTYQIAEYEVYVKHGFLPGFPGTDACAAIVKRGACPASAADSTAEFLDSKQIELARW